jgi:hypothetical protein
MYRLEIMGPKGRQVLEWDPDKLQQREPCTIKTMAEANKLFREAIAHTKILSAGDEAMSPKMAVSGRWYA